MCITGNGFRGPLTGASIAIVPVGYASQFAKAKTHCHSARIQGMGHSESDFGNAPPSSVTNRIDEKQED
jgi:hypothetical protein